MPGWLGGHQTLHEINTHLPLTLCRVARRGRIIQFTKALKMRRLTGFETEPDDLLGQHAHAPFEILRCEKLRASSADFSVRHKPTGFNERAIIFQCSSSRLQQNPARRAETFSGLFGSTSLVQPHPSRPSSTAAEFHGYGRRNNQQVPREMCHAPARTESPLCATSTSGSVTRAQHFRR